MIEFEEKPSASLALAKVLGLPLEIKTEKGSMRLVRFYANAERGGVVVTAEYLNSWQSLFEGRQDDIETKRFECTEVSVLSEELFL
jgi:hypothetical protein